MTIHLRNLTPAPSSVDLSARTVEAIISTGADVQRGSILERLDIAGADLSRLVGGPVLDGHRAGSTRDQLGVIESAEVRGGVLVARLRFRSNEAAIAVLRDIGDGTVRGLSVGYTVQKWREVREGGQRVKIAEKWTPVEVSVVPVPADPGAQFRNLEGTIMEPDDDLMTATPPPADTVQTRAEVNREIRSIAATSALDRAWADAQIDAGATADEARRAAFEEMQARDRATPVRSTRASVGFSNDDPAVIAERAGEALFARAHPDHQLSPQARPFAYMTILDHARESLRRSGASTTGLSPDTIVTRAGPGYHSTGDFPLILGDVVGRELRRAYQVPASGVRRLARQAAVRDFRPKTSIASGPAAPLEKVLESGEFTYGSMVEAAESYRAETFGRIFAISRQAIINDDLGAFTSISAKMGAAARTFEAAQLAALINDNPTMADTKQVFHKTSHGNTDTASSGSDVVADFTSDLDAARLAMRKQKGLGGEIIGVEPRFVLVPPDLETTAQKALAAIQATKAADVNPFSHLELIVEPRLSSTSRWYLAADPAQIDGIEYAYLEGAPGPQIETRMGFEVDGVEIKVRLDFGCGWLDWRGWYRVGA